MHRIFFSHTCADRIGLPKWRYSRGDVAEEDLQDEIRGIGLVHEGEQPLITIKFYCKVSNEYYIYTYTYTYIYLGLVGICEFVGVNTYIHS